MKILLIANYQASSGGISVQVDLLLHKLKEEGIRATLFNTKGNNLYRATLLPLQLLLKGSKFDCFHIHGCSYKGFLPVIIGVCIGRLLRKKIIVTYHGGDAEDFFREHTSLVLHLLKRTHTNTVHSTFLKRVFDQYNIPCIMVPNIIDEHPQPVRSRSKIAPILITTRALEPLYNIKNIIMVFSIVQRKYNEAKLHIVGTGSMENELKAFVSAINLKNVHFEGKKSNNEIYTELAKADFWCNASLKDNMPVSLIEAMNAGLVIISSNVGGIPNMVEHNLSALLFDPSDTAGMANSILQLVDRPEAANHLLVNSRNVVKEYYWVNVRKTLLSLYH
jgi:glycosyltransferase involved in cell wall biosynthesis